MHNHFSLLITKSYAIINWLKPEHVIKIKETFYDQNNILSKVRYDGIENVYFLTRIQNRMLLFY